LGWCLIVGPDCKGAALNRRNGWEVHADPASFETAASRPPQDEENFSFHVPIFLILRSARCARREGRTMPIQPRRRRFIMNFGRLRSEFSTFASGSRGKQAPHSNPFRGGFFAL